MNRKRGKQRNQIQTSLPIYRDGPSWGIFVSLFPGQGGGTCIHTDRRTQPVRSPVGLSRPSALLPSGKLRRFLLARALRETTAGGWAPPPPPVILGMVLSASQSPYRGTGAVEYMGVKSAYHMPRGNVSRTNRTFQLKTIAGVVLRSGGGVTFEPPSCSQTVTKQFTPRLILTTHNAPGERRRT